jgi:UDP-N-acetylglucosamine 2-epimerase
VDIGREVDMKVLFFYGTRPELIKLGLLMEKCEEHYEVYRVCTGQHHSLFDGIDSLFKSPDETFLVPEHRSISSLTEHILKYSDETIKRVKPDIVIVQGDTCTSFSCAISAFYNKVKIGHVEAGLRTYNNKSPYPEEFYRKSISNIADYHWCPTEESLLNLKREKVNGEKFVTGNTIVDTIMHFCNKENIASNDVIITLHRRENEDIFENILCQIDQLSKIYLDLNFILLSHPNPIIQDKIRSFNSDHVSIVPPLPYLDFIKILSTCKCVITDSGGVQEEAVTLRKKTLICRDKTERDEGVSVGVCRLVGSDVLGNFSWLLDPFVENYKNPYGDGDSCDLIIKTLSSVLGR